MPPPPPLRGWSSIPAAMLGDIEPLPGFALRRVVKRYPEPVAHGLEARKPSHPHGPRQHRLQRDPSLNHEIDVELP